ncbi:MAG: cyclic nucleotide-binding domain-containing protein [Lachnospiraceae bacterium]|nr:cyclic nucleotide-binding domain-containing protein [Lachnospiraceae bacterium]
MYGNNPVFQNPFFPGDQGISKKYTAEVSPGDLAKIVQKYGSRIQDIYDLGPGQSWMFHAKNNNQSAFFLQMVLKAEMKLRPVDFKRRVDAECEKNETLRFAYVYRGLKKPYCVCLKDRRAELSFEDLSSIKEDDIDRTLEKYSEADRRRGFDLEKDPLLRIHIYKLKKEDNYAIILSQPHINSDGTSIGILIKELFIDYVLNIDPKLQTGGSEYKSIAVSRNKADLNRELSYWKEYLEGLTEEIFLPGMQKSKGEFKETVYTCEVPKALTDAMKTASKKHRTTIYNIMQAAWGIMLNRLTGRKDIIFGAITSGRDAHVFQSMNIPGGFVKVLPVRLQLADDQMFGDVVSSLQKDFVHSMENSDCSVEQIKEAIGYKGELFDHILNCHNFEGARSFSGDGGGLPGFRIMGASVYDNLSEDLAVYIRSDKEGMSLGLGYNAAVFSRETIQLYAESYLAILKQILFSENDPAIGELALIDASQFELTAQLRQCEELKKTMLLKKHPVFACAEWDDLAKAVRKVEILMVRSADTVFLEHQMLTDLYIVITGFVVLKATTASGWKNPVKACGPGSLIGISGILKDIKTGFEAEVISDEATILRVPAEALRYLMKSYTQIGEEITTQVYREYNKYMKMWLNS